MTIIRYEHEELPPFPAIDVAVSGVMENNYIPGIGKIDTGAVITTIPHYVVGLLNLIPASEIPLRGYDNKLDVHSVYVVHIKIDDVVFEYVDVIATPHRHILVGRNLINMWQMKLDGKNHIGEFEIWTTNTDSVPRFYK